MGSRPWGSAPGSGGAGRRSSWVWPGGAALVGLALFLLLFVFFLRDYDRVSEWEGQTVVAEYRGIDRGSHQCPRVCRYESWLLRGEELGPGR